MTDHNPTNGADPMTKTVHTIAATISTGSQSMTLTEIFVREDHRLRVTIKSDSYAQQCFARIARWNGEEWKAVHSIPASKMQTPTGLKSSPRMQRAKNDEQRAEPFADDRFELERVAAEIIGIVAW